jgi:alpha-galactosidase
VSASGDQEIWMKQLADGGKAIGLFNRGAAAADVQVKWADVGITGNHKLRDLWTRADVKWDATGYSASVPSHGVVLIRVSK